MHRRQSGCKTQQLIHCQSLVDQHSTVNSNQDIFRFDRKIKLVELSMITKQHCVGTRVVGVVAANKVLFKLDTMLEDKK
jgi:hypothetical protein